MRKAIIAGLLFVTLAPACHVAVDSDGSRSGTTADGGGSSSETASGGATGTGDGAAPTTGTGTTTGTDTGTGTSTDTGTTTDTGTGTLTDTGTGTLTDTGTGTLTDTGTGTLTDTGTGTTTDTGTTTSTDPQSATCPPETGWPSGSILAGQLFPWPSGPYRVVVDGTGDAVVAGQFFGQITLGDTVLTQIGQAEPSTPDVFVAKLDPCGEVLWAIGYGSVGEDLFFGLEADAAGDVYFATSVPEYAPTSRIIKLDPQGNELWHVDAHDMLMGSARGLAVTPDGGLVIAGTTTGPVNLGSGPIPDHPGDAFVARLDGGGNVMWTGWAGFAVDVDVVAVVVGAQGEAFVSGLVQEQALAVAEIDPGGQAVWHYESTGIGLLDFPKLAADGTGNLYVAGRYSGDVDFGVGNPSSGDAMSGFVMKLDGSGAVAWLHVLMTDPGPFDRVGTNTLALAPDGSVQIAGDYRGHVADFGGGPLPDVGSEQMYFARLAPDGSVTWLSTSTGTTMLVGAHDAAAGPDGRMWVTGFLMGSMDLADGTVVASGNDQGVLLRVAP